MAQVDLKRKLIHRQAHDYKARGSVTLSRGLELGDEEKLMEDSKAGDRLKDYYLTPVFIRTQDLISIRFLHFLFLHSWFYHYPSIIGHTENVTSPA